MDEDTRRGAEPLGASRCRRCGTKLDAATDVDGDASPSAGDVSVCLYCGTVSLFDDDLALREPTLDELEQILDDPHVERLLDRMWTSHLASARSGGDVRFACGCHVTSGAGLFVLEACNEICAAAQTVWRMVEASGKTMSVIR